MINTIKQTKNSLIKFSTPLNTEEILLKFLKKGDKIEWALTQNAVIINYQL
jgi:hypothetical protein